MGVIKRFIIRDNVRSLGNEYLGEAFLERVERSKQESIKAKKQMFKELGRDGVISMETFNKLSQHLSRKTDIQFYRSLTKNAKKGREFYELCERDPKFRSKYMDSSVANEILRQLGGAGRLKAMIGASNFTAGSDYLMFVFKGSRQYNTIKVKLNTLDYYNLEFGKIFNYKHTILKKIDNVEVSNLISTIENIIKLYLKL